MTNQMRDWHRQHPHTRTEDETAALVCLVLFAWGTVFMLALVWILT